MADTERCVANDLELLTSHKSDENTIRCGNCAKLESQLLNAQEELKTSRLIIELLLEDVKCPGETNEDASCTRIDETKTSLNENNWTEIQVDRRRKNTANLKDLNEIWVKTRGCSETLTNFKDVYSAIRNSGNGPQISLSERNWIQIQTGQHKKIIDKLKDHEETYVRTKNRFEILSNLNEATESTKPVKGKTPKPSEAIRNNMDKSKSKDSVRINMM
jgi:hypothetical protein